MGNEELYVGVDLSSKPQLQTYTYERTDITFRGELKNFNYNSILKDKQTNIYKLYELANYYVDSDSIFGGIVKRVLAPFSLSSGYKLKGVSEKIKKKYTDHYESISFLDVSLNIFFELYLFAQCYIYFMPDGRLITLPQHRVRISDIMVNGEPLIEFNVIELNRRSGYAKEKFINTLIEKYRGYPPEITEELLKGNTGAWIQLNPENCFILQESKPMWQKYAVPFISTCLKPLSKKELISYYEDVQLNIGAKGFLHVKLGDNELLPKPNQIMLDATAKIFQDALNKFPLAVTSHLIDAKFISVDTKGMFDKSKYAEVNSQIMSSGGISPLVVTGESEGSSFAQANISVKTACQRIKQSQDNFSEMMKKFNKKLAIMWRIAPNKVPSFVFNDLDLIGEEKLKDEAFKLWQQGCVSTTTLLDQHGYDVEQEYERKKSEEEKDFKTVFEPPANSNTMPSEPSAKGAPKKSPVSTDKNKSQTGKQPKPSTQ